MNENGMASVSPVEKLLGFGIFQILAFFNHQWIVFIQSANLVFMAFGKAIPKEWGFDGPDEYMKNFTNTSKCECTQTMDGCGNFTWKGDFNSIVTQWELVCDRSQLVFVIMTVQMAGIFVGTLIFGQVSDNFGRKLTLLGCVSAALLFDILSAFSPDWKIFTCLLCLAGLSAGGTIPTSRVLLIELLTQKHRLWTNAIAGPPLSFLILSLFAYLTQDWSKLLLATSVAGLPTLALIIFVGESPRWLLQAGKWEEAEVKFRRIARINGHVLDESELSQVINTAKTDDKQKSETEIHRNWAYLNLFSSKFMAIRTSVFALTCFSFSTMLSGITFTVDLLSGSIYLNFFIMAGLRLLGNILMITADIFTRVERKTEVALPFSLAGAGFAIIAILLLTGQHLSNLSTILTILSLIVVALLSSTWVVVPVSVTENYPTLIRSTASALCTMCDRMAYIIMPLFLYLGQLWAPAPSISFTILCTLSVILFLIFIPETKGLPLPEMVPIRTRSPEKASTNTRIYQLSPPKQETDCEVNSAPI